MFAAFEQKQGEETGRIESSSCAGPSLCLQDLERVCPRNYGAAERACCTDELQKTAIVRRGRYGTAERQSDNQRAVCAVFRRGFAQFRRLDAELLRDAHDAIGEKQTRLRWPVQDRAEIEIEIETKIETATALRARHARRHEQPATTRHKRTGKRKRIRNKSRN